MAKNHTEEESSSEEMEVSSPGNADSGSESESESEPEPKKPPVAAPKKPQPQSQQDSSSSTEEESDSESDPDPLTQKPNPVVKPIDETKKAVRSKPNASPMKKGTKRPAADDDVEAKEKESKRSKKKQQEKEIDNPVKKTQTQAPNEDVKRQLFQRLWSEDDEIAILKGMIDYRSKKKADPVADLSAFHEFIKKNLHVDVTKAQLQDKIRRLKKKYENNAGKEKKGKERIFSKPHEQKGYELSKKIWGKEKNDKVENNVTASKDNGVLVEVKEEKKSEEVEKNVEVKHNLSLISVTKNVAEMEMWLVENCGVLSVEKRNEMKKKFTALNVIEFDLSSRRTKLIYEQKELVREAMRASGIHI
ncbi:probable transcription factor At1g11510 [Lycium barbarum]|uniref:probable transcription factor At1g11510 n=1 Tax=Lycium barbarum TaxID=112863 RepID=UPI00293E6C48|nr:probable transcription factor At1g11510 [Lycium barbarum]